MFKDYESATRWLFAQLPMFQRDGAAAYKADLNNTIRLCKALNNPENDFPCIHIAGTNGKGSTSHMLASIFQEAGYKTGLYTSPHLSSFTERIRINGEPIPEKAVLDFLNETRPLLEEIRPSFFETTVAMAFSRFSSEKVDIAIIETGMGGRLDSTNVVHPLISVITNIGADHIQFLGDTFEKIASQKAGIIKPGIPVVIGRKHPETDPVFMKMAKKNMASLYFAQDLVKVEAQPWNTLEKFRRFDIILNQEKEIINSPLTGDYQRENIGTVRTVLHCLKTNGGPDLENFFKKGVENILLNTGFWGRWQILDTQPLCIADTGHNADGFGAAMQQLSTLQAAQYRLVLGFVSDKDVTKLLSLIPFPAKIYACAPAIPRALPVGELKKILDALNWESSIFPDVYTAFVQAKKDSDKNDVIFVGGSTFVVAELHKKAVH